jgi:3-phosphoshikimate 1-carboxyvinyltransferase
LLLIKALSGSDLPIANLSMARDTQIMEEALQIISARRDGYRRITIDVADAGTAMRFLTAYLSITPGNWLLTGSPRMCARPIGFLADALRLLGAQIEYFGDDGFPPLQITGGELKSYEVNIEAGISSQFISALMLIAPVLPNGLTIRMTGQSSSAPYIAMTKKLMEQAGAEVEQNGEFILIGQQLYNPDVFKVESDWSAAAFWYEIAAFSEDAVIQLSGLNDSGLQGDSQVVSVFEQFGVKTEFTSKGVVISRTTNLKTALFSYDFNSCPDLALPVAATCAGLNVGATLSGLKSLKIKESNRFEVLLTELGKLGYAATELPGDVLQILPCEAVKQSGGTHIVETYNDHRVAMAFAPLAMFHKGIEISKPDVVDKSYPGFWNDLRHAGFLLEF